jgi:hypothetical protein
MKRKIDLLKRIKADPDHCPYCKSDNMDCFSTSLTAFGHTDTVVCCDCQRSWVEHIEYKLIKVEEKMRYKVVNWPNESGDEWLVRVGEQGFTPIGRIDKYVDKYDKMEEMLYVLRTALKEAGMSENTLAVIDRLMKEGE